MEHEVANMVQNISVTFSKTIIQNEMEQTNQCSLEILKNIIKCLVLTLSLGLTLYVLNYAGLPRRYEALVLPLQDLQLYCGEKAHTHISYCHVSAKINQ